MIRWFLQVALLLASSSVAKGDDVLTLERFLDEAKNTHPGVNEATSRLESARHRETAAKGAFWPSLSVEGASGESRIGDSSERENTLHGTLRYNIYRAGADQAAARGAGEAHEKARLELALERSQATREAAAVFFEILRQRQVVAIFEDALRANSSQLQIARRRLEGGFGSSADILEFELRAQALESELVLLKSRLSDALRRLNLLRGLPSDTSVTINGTWALVTTPPSLPETFDQGMLASAPALSPIQKDVEISRAMTDGIRSTFQPRADLEARYGHLTNPDSSVPDGTGWFVGGRISVNLFDGSQTKAEKNARLADQKTADIRLKRTADELRVRITGILDEHRALTTLRRSQGENLKKAERYLEITLAEYRRGVKQSPDLLGAAEKLTNARIREADLALEHRSLHLRYLAALGLEFSPDSAPR